MTSGYFLVLPSELLTLPFLIYRRDVAYGGAGILCPKPQNCETPLWRRFVRNTCKLDAW